MSRFALWRYRLRYWLPSERRALLQRLEMAVELGAIRRSSDAMAVWDREVPNLWRGSWAMRQRLYSAWDTRLDYEAHA